MTRLTSGHLGAETGHDHAENLIPSGSGTVTYDTGTMRSGARSWKFDSTAGNQSISERYTFTGALDTTYYATVWFYIPSASGLPSANTRILAIATGGGVTIAQVGLTTTGKIRLLNQTATQIGSDSSETVTTDTWHRADLSVRVETGSTDEAEVRLNGVSVASTVEALNETAPGRVNFGWFGAPGASEVIYIDDFVVNDGAGSVNNTWADDEKVVLLLPTSDSDRGTWTGGGGGTTNLFEALNNIPPAGLDNAAATDTSQIEDATNPGDWAFFDCASYASAGIASGDTITCVYGVCEGGNSSTTGTDLLTIGIFANPSADADKVSGSIDINDGTYPTGWNRIATLMTENPSISSVSDQPQLEFLKNVPTTRVAACCFAGVYVSYTEGAAGSRGPQVIWIG